MAEKDFSALVKEAVHKRNLKESIKGEKKPRVDFDTDIPPIPKLSTGLRNIAGRMKAERGKY